MPLPKLPAHIIINKAAHNADDRATNTATLPSKAEDLCLKLSELFIEDANLIELLKNAQLSSSYQEKRALLLSKLHHFTRRIRESHDDLGGWTYIDPNNAINHCNHVINALHTAYLGMNNKFSLAAQQILSEPISTRHSKKRAQLALNGNSPTRTASPTNPRASNPSPRPQFELISTKILSQWFKQNLFCPYPTDLEKEELSSACSISREQVSNWMINMRMRKWKKMLISKIIVGQKGMTKLEAGKKAEQLMLNAKLRGRGKSNSPTNSDRGSPLKISDGLLMQNIISNLEKDSSNNSVSSNENSNKAVESMEDDEDSDFDHQSMVSMTHESEAEEKELAQGKDDNDCMVDSEDDHSSSSVVSIVKESRHAGMKFSSSSQVFFPFTCDEEELNA
jgi:hypothetical protein